MRQKHEEVLEGNDCTVSVYGSKGKWIIYGRTKHLGDRDKRNHFFQDC